MENSNSRIITKACLRICVIDGQGGGIGSLIIRGLKQEYGEAVEILALGTNAIATSQMMKANANWGATGENAIITTVAQADVVIGTISIILANAMMGEVTPAMATAVSSCQALKLLLPLNQEQVEIITANHEPLPHQVEYLVKNRLKELLQNV